MPQEYKKGANTMPERVYNFSPGPATLPLEVLEKGGQDIVNFKNSGIGLI